MKIRISTSQNVSIEYQLASVGERMLAYGIDFLICGAYALLVWALTDALGVFNTTTAIAFIAIPFILYEVVCEIAFDGQTVGKMSQQIKVVSLSGQQPNVGQYLIRWLFRPIDFWIGNGGIALTTVILSGKGQRIGDMVASTSVVSIAERQQFSTTLFPEIDESYEPMFPQVVALSDSDIRIVKEVVANYKKTRESKPLQLLSVKIQQLHQIETELPHLHFLKQVIQDHQHLTAA